MGRKHPDWDSHSFFFARSHAISRAYYQINYKRQLPQKDRRADAGVASSPGSPLLRMPCGCCFSCSSSLDLFPECWTCWRSCYSAMLLSPTCLCRLSWYSLLSASAVPFITIPTLHWPPIPWTGREEHGCQQKLSQQGAAYRQYIKTHEEELQAANMRAKRAQHQVLQVQQQVSLISNSCKEPPILNVLYSFIENVFCTQLCIWYQDPTN